MDARKKKVLTVLALGSVILVWRLAAVVNKYFPSSASAAQVEAVAQDSPDKTPAPAASTRQSAVWQQQDEIAQQAWGRDPFSEVPGIRRPEVQPNTKVPEPTRTQPPAPQLRFTGISRGGDRWMALLDGKIMCVGDRVSDGFEVVSIDRRSVTLGAGSWLYRYELGVQEAVVRPRAEEP